MRKWPCLLQDEDAPGPKTTRLRLVVLDYEGACDSDRPRATPAQLCAALHGAFLGAAVFELAEFSVPPRIGLVETRGNTQVAVTKEYTYL